MIMLKPKVAAACGINGDVFTQVILMAVERVFFMLLHLTSYDQYVGVLVI